MRIGRLYIGKMYSLPEDRSIWSVGWFRRLQEHRRKQFGEWGISPVLNLWPVRLIH